MISKIKEDALENDVPIIKDGGLEFLLKIIKERNCKDILELGTAVGYSSINMAHLNNEIKIDTIEKNQEMYEKAILNIKEEGLDDRIKVFFMPIEEFKTDRVYDLIFVDAAKGQYPKYLEQFLGNLKEDGLMFFDNMVFHNMIYDVDNIRSKRTRSLVKKIIKFRENIVKDDRFTLKFYNDVGDGILVLERRKDER